MKDWWTQLSAREQIMIGAAVILAFFVLIYQFGFKPLSGAHEQAVRGLERQLAESQIVQNGLIRLQQLATQSKQVQTSSESLELMLSRTSSAVGLEIVRLQPAEGDGLLVWFDKAEPRTVNRWMHNLETTSGLSVIAMDLRRRPDEPVLRGSITFRRSS